MKCGGYILVTPAKNEESVIGNTISSILMQNIKPKLWVIVNDASTDSTGKIIDGFAKKYKWIIHMKLTESSDYDLNKHVSEIYVRGIKYAFAICNRMKIHYNFIASLDADTTLDPAYFETLMKRLSADPRIGLASGNLITMEKDKKIVSRAAITQVSGTGRMWTKKCYIETQGYEITCSQDAVSNIKAILKGFSITRFKDLEMFQQRHIGEHYGFWKGYKSLGYRYYYLFYHPIHVILKMVKLVLTPPFYYGFAFITGYISSYIQKKERTSDRTIKEYFSQVNHTMEPLKGLLGR